MFDAWVSTTLKSGPQGRFSIHSFFSNSAKEISSGILWKGNSPSLQPPFMRFTSSPQDLFGHLHNKLGNWLTEWRKQKMANMICRLFRDQLTWKGTMVQCDISGCFLLWTHNPTSSTTLLLLYLMEPVCFCFFHLFWGNPEPGIPGWQRPYCIMWLDSVISHSSWNCAMIHFYNLNSYLVGLPGWTWWMCMIKQNKEKGQCL